MEKGSLRLTAGFEDCGYVLLHHNHSQELYKLANNGPRIISGEKLKTYGFNTQRDFYLAFDLEAKPIKSGDDLFKLKKSDNHYSQSPYFMTLEELSDSMI